jgi:multicomponent Na+:H+ antiporter subunit G
MFEFIGYVIIFIGSLIAIIGSFGLLRFPDVYTRSHAQTVTIVGGVCLILIGILTSQPISQTTIKIIFLIIFIFLTSPTATHAITKAAYRSGIKPKVKKDELASSGNKKEKKRIIRKVNKKSQVSLKPHSLPIVDSHS